MRRDAVRMSASMNLRSGFLWSLIGSLCVAAALGIAALLLPTLFPQTGEILSTALVIAMTSMLCLACAVALERNRSVAVAWVGIVAAAGAALCWIFIIWSGLSWWGSSAGDFERLMWRIGSTLNTVAIWAALLSLLAVRSANVARLRWSLRVVGGLLTALALLTIIGIWFGFDSWWWLPELFASLVTLLGWTVWMSVFMLVPCRRKVSIVIARSTAVVGALLAAVVLLLIWEVLNDDDSSIRLLSALIILTACGTLIVPILGLLDRQAHRASLQSVSQRMKIELICPRCHTSQQLATGHAACQTCGLRIEINVQEPRCTCGYLIYQLQSDKCPECGRLLPAESRWLQSQHSQQQSQQQTTQQ